MRRLPSPHQAFDNTVNSRFELYDDGEMVAYVKYRMEAETIVFLICHASHQPSANSPLGVKDLAEHRIQLLCSEAFRDVYRRHLRSRVVSRAIKAMIDVPTTQPGAIQIPRRTRLNVKAPVAGR